MLYDLIIIGGGPAGITAGIYAARKKLKTLLITKDFLGQLGKTGHVENWPGFLLGNGMELMKQMEKQLKSFDIDVVENVKVASIKKKDDFFSIFTMVKDKMFLGKAIIITAGREPKKLGIKGEEEFIGRGVAYCSICEAPFFKDKAVAVIGSGNAGLEAVLDLVKYASKIFIFEQGFALKGDELLQEKVKAENKVELFLGKVLEEIIGDKMVQAIRYKDLNSDKTFQMPMHGVFVAIGSQPATDFASGIVATNKDNEIEINPETCQTSVKGIFAAGDVANGKWKQAIIAAGEGAKAALGAYEYLQKM